VAKNDIVVVSFHGGAEGPTNQHVPRGAEIYLGEERGDLRKFTHAMIDAGADLLIGHGPHVVRGMEVYRGRLIAYSLGNFATYGKFQLAGPTSWTLVLEAQLGADGAFLGGKIHPALQIKPGGPRLDQYRTVIPVVRQLSMDDFGANAVKISDDGTISTP
jgi:poly-gamma-glutamate capsule biosynthesis protein CapA/YwtB (metallophosphatase superfamily)